MSVRVGIDYIYYTEVKNIKTHFLFLHVFLGSFTPEYSGSWNNKLSEPEVDLSLPPKPRLTSAHSQRTKTPAIQKDKFNRQTFHQHLANYFLCQSFSERAMHELPWQLEMSGDFKRLHSVIMYPK